MHDDGLGLEPSGPFGVEAKLRRVFAEGREVGRRLALVLDAQEHDRIGTREGLLEVVHDADLRVGFF